MIRRKKKEFVGEENKNSTIVGRSKVVTVNNALSNTHATGCLFLTAEGELGGYVIIVYWKDHSLSLETENRGSNYLFTPYSVRC